jgi:hypothetical protein
MQSCAGTRAEGLSHRRGPRRAASDIRRGWLFRPGHGASQVGGDQPPVRWVPDENRVDLGKRDERGHRRRAGSNNVTAVVACHDHQLKIAVFAIGPGNPIRVHDLDATRFLTRSRHGVRVETSACRQLCQQNVGSAYVTPGPVKAAPAHVRVDQSDRASMLCVGLVHV